MKSQPVCPLKMRDSALSGLSLLGISLLSTSLLSPLHAQPPEPPRPPKPPVPPITLEELTTLAGGPTRITMHLKDATYLQILAELSKQSGVRVRGQFWDEAQRKKTFTVDIENQPFWDAVRIIGDQLKIFPQQWGGQAGLVLTPDSDGRLRGAKQLSAPMMTAVVRGIQRTHNVNYSSPENANPAQAKPDTPRISLTGLLMVDPKLRLLNNMARSKVTEAVDDKGVSLVADKEEGWLYGDNQLLWQLQFSLKYRPDIGKKLTRLNGSLRFYVVARFDTWEITDLDKAKGASKTVKLGKREETYTVDSIAKEGEGYRIKLTVSRKVEAAPPPEEATPEAQQLRQARRDLARWMSLKDAAGQEYYGYFAGGSFNEGAEDNIEFVFNNNQQFPGDEKAGDPKKLRIDIPIEFRELTVPINFKDLVLP